jgi:hypothetical protein
MCLLPLPEDDGAAIGAGGETSDGISAGTAARIRTEFAVI